MFPGLSKVWDFLQVNKKHEKIWHPVRTPDSFLVVFFLFFGIEGFRQKPLNSHTVLSFLTMFSYREQPSRGSFLFLPQ